MFKLRRPTRLERYLLVAASLALVLVVTLSNVIEPASTGRVSQTSMNLKVNELAFHSELDGRAYKLIGEIHVLSGDRNARNAKIALEITYPNGDTDQTELTADRDGIAKYRERVWRTGTYSFEITDIVLRQMEFDAAASEATSATIEITETGSQPPVEEEPTATPTEETEEADPTATPTEETDPTATPTEETDPTATPTEEADPTATPTEDGGEDHEHSGSMATWHAPGSHDGLPAHDHGDAPPQWVLDAGYSPAYSHAANTPNENMVKHTAMKGISATMNGMNVYVIAHLDTNPNGQQGRFHSYQYWMQDPSGGVSNIHGWMDFGDGNNTLPNIRAVDSCGVTQSVRPIISVNYPECDLVMENWYSRAGGSGLHAPDFGFNLSSQYYHGPEQGVSSSASLDDIETWLPTGNKNSNRRMEVAWYADRTDLRGEFYTDQWGRVLSGPDDPSVGTTRTIGSNSYVVLALKQYIAPTAQTLKFPGNSVQKSYPMASPFELPN